MKKLLSFIVVTAFTTLTTTAQQLNNSTAPDAPETSIVKMNASDEVRRQVITDLNNRNKLTDMQVTLYPNPSSDLLNISFNADSQNTVTVVILDVLGKKVLEENFNSQIGNNIHSVFVSRFKNGLYYVNVRNENGVSTQRFTKN